MAASLGHHLQMKLIKNAPDGNLADTMADGSTLLHLLLGCKDSTVALAYREESRPDIFEVLKVTLLMSISAASCTDMHMS